MQITFESISDLSITMLDDKPDLELGSQIGIHSHGIQPTYGMTADSMGFNSFTMAIKLGDKHV